MEEVKFKYGTINFKEIDNLFLLNDIEIKPYQGDIYTGIISYLLKYTIHPETIRFYIDSEDIWNAINDSPSIKKISMKDCRFISNDNSDIIPLKLHKVNVYDTGICIAVIYAIPNDNLLISSSFDKNEPVVISNHYIMTVDLVETLNTLMQYDTKNVASFIARHPEIQLETGSEAIDILNKYCIESQDDHVDECKNQTLQLIRSIDPFEYRSLYFTCDFLDKINSALLDEKKQYVVCISSDINRPKTEETFFRICDLSFDMYKPVGYMWADKDDAITEIVIPELYHRRDASRYDNIINNAIKMKLDVNTDDIIHFIKLCICRKGV